MSTYASKIHVEHPLRATTFCRKHVDQIVPSRLITIDEYRRRVRLGIDNSKVCAICVKAHEHY